VEKPHPHSFWTSLAHIFWTREKPHTHIFWRRGKPHAPEKPHSPKISVDVKTSHAQNEKVNETLKYYYSSTESINMINSTCSISATTNQFGTIPQE
jgi:hypothetical protein